MKGSLYGGGQLQVGSSDIPASSVAVTGSITGLASILFIAATVQFDASSIISADGTSITDGPGKGTISGVYSGGASHGGSGGSFAPSTVGVPYGSYTTPTLSGSRGGPSPLDGTGMVIFICNNISVNAELENSGRSWRRSDKHCGINPIHSQRCCIEC